MANKTFDRITKMMAILLVLCFVLSVTAVSVNAAAFEQNKFFDHSGKYKHATNTDRITEMEITTDKITEMATNTNRVTKMVMPKALTTA